MAVSIILSAFIAAVAVMIMLATAALEGQLTLDVTPTPTGPHCPRCRRPMVQWTRFTMRCDPCRYEIVRVAEEAA